MAQDRTTLQVDLGSRSYPIIIADGLMRDSSLLREAVSSDQALVVTNETIKPHYLDALLTALGDKKVDVVVLPDGEQYKSLDTVATIYDALLENGHNRTTTLVALGGGVVGDMTGFAAATYQRGVRFVQIPTTLLAQVDSSVGGKTGVNHPAGKNMIGAFHQPDAVIIDTATLDTLPPREFRAGLAEVIKYGLIADAEFLDWLEKNLDKVMARETEAIQYAIARSCENKARVVAADEREGGIRAILNLGHTFGHALETATAYQRLLHGEAVACGMVMALDLSLRQGCITEQERQRCVTIIESAGLPVSAIDGLPDVDGMIELMGLDKKVQHGKLRLVLLSAIGSAEVTSHFSEAALRDTLASFLSSVE